jgi:serine/threonine protein kinase
VKVLSASYAESERVRRSFHAATRQAARLDHPNIVRSFGPGEGSDPYLHSVAELLDGTPLTAYLKPGLAYEPPHALPMVRAILQALVSAHQSGMVHGDLKPENIFLVRHAGGPPVVKVLDFGMIDVINAAGGVTARSPSGELLGHAGYLSPEQVRGVSAIDGRADVFSVGVLFYELLTGRLAFPGADDDAKLRAVAQAEPLAIDHGKPELAPWKEFFSQILVREADRRLPSASAMEQALMGAAEGAGHARPRTVPSATTDMSPELPPGMGGRRGPSVRPVIVIGSSAPAIVEASPPSSAPIVENRFADRGARPAPVGVPIWVLLVVSAICAALGFAAGLLAAER